MSHIGDLAEAKKVYIGVSDHETSTQSQLFDCTRIRAMLRQHLLTVLRRISYLTPGPAV